MVAARARAWPALVGVALLGGLVLGGCNLFDHEADDDDDPDAPPPICLDGSCGPPPDGMEHDCNPLATPGTEGCFPGRKCAWVVIAQEPETLGRIGCVPDGTVPLGGACVVGPPGELTGFDDCVSGSVCVSGTCRDVCGFDDSVNAACAAGSSCVRIAGLYGNGGDDPVAGACGDSCDPLTQVVTNGGTCGSGNGCYLFTSTTTTVAVCASAGTLTHGQPITGPVFANSCAPGHLPRRASPASNTFECSALCRPAAVTSTMNMAREGGIPPFTCAARGAAPPDSVTAGESCRFYWAREPFDELSPFSNTVGFCWKHAVWQYDTNEDQLPDAPFPRCPTLTTGDVVPPIGNPPHNDAFYFWCVPTTAAVFGRPAGASHLPPTRSTARASASSRCRGSPRP